MNIEEVSKLRDEIMKLGDLNNEYGKQLLKMDDRVKSCVFTKEEASELSKKYSEYIKNNMELINIMKEQINHILQIK